MQGTGRNSYTVGVKLLSGKSFSVLIGPTDTVAALKQRIFEREGIPPQKQNLLVMGKLLQPDNRPLAEYTLKAGDMVYVTAGVRGDYVADPGCPLGERPAPMDPLVSEDVSPAGHPLAAQIAELTAAGYTCVGALRRNRSNDDNAAPSIRRWGNDQETYIICKSKNGVEDIITVFTAWLDQSFKINGEDQLRPAMQIACQAKVKDLPNSDNQALPPEERWGWALYYARQMAERAQQFADIFNVQLIESEQKQEQKEVSLQTAAASTVASSSAAAAASPLPTTAIPKNSSATPEQYGHSRFILSSASRWNQEKKTTQDGSQSVPVPKDYFLIGDYEKGCASPSSLPMSLGGAPTRMGKLLTDEQALPLRVLGEQKVKALKDYQAAAASSKDDKTDSKVQALRNKYFEVSEAFNIAASKMAYRVKDSILSPSNLRSIAPATAPALASSSSSSQSHSQAGAKSSSASSTGGGTSSSSSLFASATQQQQQKTSQAAAETAAPSSAAAAAAAKRPFG